MPDNDTSRSNTHPERDPAAELERLEELAKDPELRRRDFEQYAFRLLSMAAVVLLAVGTVVYRIVEGWGWIDAFYFSAIAVTTVGFGDLTPTSDGAKVFTVFYVFSGIAIITSFLNIRLKRHARAIAASRKGPDSSAGGTH